MVYPVMYLFSKICRLLRRASGNVHFQAPILNVFEINSKYRRIPMGKNVLELSEKYKYPFPSSMIGPIEAFIAAGTSREAEDRSAFPKSAGNSHLPAYIRNPIMKFFYSAMLIGMDRDLIFDFWRKHPLCIDGRDLPLEKMLTHFWNPRAKTPLDYTCLVMRDLELFCNERGIEYCKLMMDALRNRLFIEPELWMLVLRALPALAASSNDARTTIIDEMDFLFGMLCPEIGLKRAVFQGPDNLQTTLFLIDSGDLKVPAIHFQSTMAPLLACLPIRFNMPEYESVVCLAEQLRACDLVSCDRGNDESSLIDQGLGHWENFGDFAGRYGFKLNPKKCQNRTVFVADQDRKCPSTGRCILRKGTAYGSPQYVFSIKFHREQCCGDALIRCLAKEINFTQRTVFHRAEQLHRETLQSLKISRAFRFNRKTESISIDSDQLTSGAQARVLKEIIQLYLNTGKTTFERKEFITNDHLICSPDNTGFAVRLNRIKEFLDAGNSPLKIVKEGRGRFRIEIEEAIRLEVE